MPGARTTVMPELPHSLGLTFNPFEPAASGPPIGIDFSPPQRIQDQVHNLVHRLHSTRGPKILAIIGEYGTGKSCLLRWLEDIVLPKNRIKPFYFDNPGIHFYDLANMLLRTIGRKDFAKLIWEFAGQHLQSPYQGDLFRKSFEEYIASESQRRLRRTDEVAQPLQNAILEADITADEQIAYCLARIVADAVRKPYFEYRDFLPHRTNALVAEAQEAPYFRAILTMLTRAAGVSGIAFLIDEFEEIGLQKRLTKRAAHNYLSTLKRLVNLAQDKDNPFWVFLSMTPDAYSMTDTLEPTLSQRFAEHDNILHLAELEQNDAIALVLRRLEAAKDPVSTGRIDQRLFPFPEELPFSVQTLCNARRLVKVCSVAISGATESTELPFSTDYLHQIEELLFPGESGED